MKKRLPCIPYSSLGNHMWEGKHKTDSGEELWSEFIPYFGMNQSTKNTCMVNPVFFILVFLNFCLPILSFNLRSLMIFIIDRNSVGCLQIKVTSCQKV